MQELFIKYALFDMDGTLADTMMYWRNLAGEALGKRGVCLAEEDVRALEKLTFGKGIAYLCDRNIPFADEITREELLSLLADHYRRDATLKKGTCAFLDSLRRSGARLAVATLTPKAQAEVCLESLHIASYFDFVLTGDDYPHGKRTPEIFLDAAASFGCALTEMHLFEDSLYSMETAHKLGIPVVAVEDRYQAHLKKEILQICCAYFEDGFSRRVK